MEKEDKGLRFVVLTYAVSRLFYLIVGAVLAEVIAPSQLQPLTLDEPSGTANIWSHFDGEHYIMLALNGYQQHPYVEAFNDESHYGSPAFFPLYPLVMRSVALVFGGPMTVGTLSLWGVLISLLAFPFALYFVYRIAEDGWGARAAQGTVLTLAFFPTSFFFNAVYTESLFLAFSAGAVWASRVRRDLLLAGILAGLATATRNVGIFLLIPLTYEWLKGVSHYRWRGAYLLIVPSGLIAYMSYLWWRFSDPLILFKEQEKWGRQATDPLVTLKNAWEQAYAGVEWVLSPQVRTEPSLGRIMDCPCSWQNTYNIMFLGLAVTLLLIGLRVLPLDLSAYAFVAGVLPTFFGAPDAPLFSLPRLLLVAFPLFIVLGVLLKNRWTLAGWLIPSAAGSLVFCTLFISWRFVA